MTLYHQTIGQGPDIVLLHGWGLHSAIWQTDNNSIAHQLAQHYRVTMIDLPGHGHSDCSSPFSFSEAVAAISELLPPQAILMGWSLGGLIAIQLAANSPDRVQRLVLLASTARFTRTDDWLPALKDTTLSQFAHALNDHPQQTIQRFLALQVRGSNNERQQLRLLKQALGERPGAATIALDSGLSILKNIDIRYLLPAVEQPCLLIQGEKDRIVPPASGTAMARLFRNGQCVTIADAGHAPFLSHPDQTLAHILGFINE